MFGGTKITFGPEPERIFCARPHKTIHEKTFVKTNKKRFGAGRCVFRSPGKAETTLEGFSICALLIQAAFN